MVNDDGILSIDRSDFLRFPNEICGTGELRQAGSGTTFLTGDNCYSGRTRITGGSLQIGNAGTSGTLGTGSVENDASLVYNRTDYYIADNPISGAGSLTVNMGELKLTGTNTYSGTTTINTGATLRIGYESSASGTLGSGTVMNNGALNFDRSGALSVPNTISGTGAVGQIGSGVTSLTGSNIYTGDTSARAGTLVIMGPVPASGFFIMHFNSMSDYGRMVLPAAPNLAGKTFNVEVPAISGPYNTSIVTWAGTATGTPSLMMNGATVTSGQFIGNVALIYGEAAGLNVTAFALPPTETTLPVTTTTTSPPSNGGDDPNGGVNLPGQPVVVQPPSPPSTTEVNVGGNSAVTGVTVTGTGLGDMIVTATVQPGPAEGMSAAPGEVYQYLTLEPARYTTITGAEITFSVPESWITGQKLTHDMIAMNRYANKQWNTLPTRFLKTENGHAFFASASPGFSYFAIIGISRSSAEVASGTSPVTETLTASPQGSVTQSPAIPVATGTTIVPAPSPKQAEPPAILVILACIGIGGVALFAVGIVARRWWIRRQNPDLFEDEK